MYLKTLNLVPVLQDFLAFAKHFLIALMPLLPTIATNLEYDLFCCYSSQNNFWENQ
jgi:hypothetical protein